MLRRLALFGDVRLPGLQDEPLGGLEPAVDQQSADQRFDDVTDDILALAGAVIARLLAEPHPLGNAEIAPDLGAGFARDQHIVAARQIAFRLVRVALVERARP